MCLRISNVFLIVMCFKVDMYTSHGCATYLTDVNSSCGTAQMSNLFASIFRKSIRLLMSVSSSSEQHMMMSSERRRSAGGWSACACSSVVIPMIPLTREKIICVSSVHVRAPVRKGGGEMGSRILLLSSFEMRACIRV